MYLGVSPGAILESGLGLLLFFATDPVSDILSECLFASSDELSFFIVVLLSIFSTSCFVSVSLFGDFVGVDREVGASSSSSCETVFNVGFR